MDGWGIAKDKSVSAIDKANTPYVDSLYSRFPNSQLQASGTFVGLPDGQMGNSEVGHTNLGAGRVVYQDLVKIDKAVAENTLQDEAVIQSLFDKAKHSRLHLIGLCSDGGVHSHVSHLKGLIKAAHDSDVEHIYVHAFTDGRDCDPRSGHGFIQEIDQIPQAQLASITGRYYAMDRDNRWERVKVAYDALSQGKGNLTPNPLDAIQQSYDQDVTDEFLKPIICTDADNQPIATIEEGDVVLMFNFRTDRGRELSMALSQKDFAEHEMKKLNIHYATMTNYDESFENVDVVFNKDNLQNTLGEVLANAGKTQVRIAETEKYPHVTFFFSGGKETEFTGEKRILCPSPKVATYDLKPEMSAYDIRDAIVPELQTAKPDFVCLNFANPDMVGHTGIMSAAIKACEVVDQCVKDVCETALEEGYTIFLLADHGNSDCLVNPDGTPNTAHTTQPVPFFVMNAAQSFDVQDGKLGDVAPSILSLLGLDIPAEMDGKVLI